MTTQQDNTLPTLQFAVATWKPDGIRRFAAIIPPSVPGVSYVVSWQAHDNAAVPETLLQRADVQVLRFDGEGQVANRNNALAACVADIIVIADDDVQYDMAMVKHLRYVYDHEPHVDVVTFTVTRPGLCSRPENPQWLTHFPQGYYVAAFELSLRRSTAGWMRFNPMLGLNARSEMCAGEDEMFLVDALRFGLRCMYVPLEVGRHPHASTGARIPTPQVLQAQGCVLAALFGKAKGRFYIFEKSMRIWRKYGISPLRTLPPMLRGASRLAQVQRVSDEVCKRPKIQLFSPR